MLSHRIATQITVQVGPFNVKKSSDIRLISEEYATWSTKIWKSIKASQLSTWQLIIRLAEPSVFEAMEKTGLWRQFSMCSVTLFSRKHCSTSGVTFLCWGQIQKLLSLSTRDTFQLTRNYSTPLCITMSNVLLGKIKQYLYLWRHTLWSSSLERPSTEWENIPLYWCTARRDRRWNGCSLSDCSWNRRLQVL